MFKCVKNVFNCARFVQQISIFERVCKIMINKQEAIMKFVEFVNDDEYITETKRKKTLTDYFAETDPNTGLKYIIPMLNSKDPHYFQKYVKYMILKEKKAEEFKRIMEWN